MSSFRITNTNSRDDTQEFVRTLATVQEPIDRVPFFDQSNRLIITRAPGRLDVMGGIADYSGSLVLQLPIRNATHVALQNLNSSKLRVLSSGNSEAPRFNEVDLNELISDAGQPISYEEARRRFSEVTEHWLAYVAGAFLVLSREKDFKFKHGAAILINSNVPEGKGVSSSAALEVAVMQAVNVSFAVGLEAQEVARLCQKVENLVAGAPCGIMDQMTSACGEENKLLELLCQPDLLRGSITLPDELELWGIDSGVRHSVGGSDYGTVRTAAFMGYRIIADITGLQVSKAEVPGKVQINDPRWRGYLANINPVQFEADFEALLPEHLNGAGFLNRYEGITDNVTSVNLDAEYPVRNATRHPIYENARVQSYAEALKNWTGLEKAPLLGRFMFESHQSYSECGLGSEATDLLVDYVREYSDAGLFGARITGGGSGGTVAVLARKGSNKSIQELTRRFRERTGYQPLVISGSSPGAGTFNQITLEKLTQ
jgi:L-arabinokinase